MVDVSSLHDQAQGYNIEVPIIFLVENTLVTIIVNFSDSVYSY